jgi:transposase-like protein
MDEVTRDPLEYANWRDTGCDLHPACLDCPLPVCIEEVPRGRQRQRLDGRSAEMRRLVRAGVRPRQVAARFGVSLRTVQRATQKWGKIQIAKTKPRVIRKKRK